MTTLRSDDAMPLGVGRELEEMGTRELSRVMIRIQELRWEKRKDLKELSEAHREAKKKAVVVKAKAFLSHSGPQEERMQVAKLAAAEAEFELDAAKSELDACVKALDLLKDDWDTVRSINANERAHALDGIGS